MSEAGWDAAWDTVFSEREWGRYPPEDLVRFIARNYYRAPDRGAMRLELGCGPGANLWYLAREGFDTWGVDGSAVAIRRAGSRLENEGLSATLQVGDINDLTGLYQAGSFDAVIDIACLQHAALDARPIIAASHALLKPGGKMFAMMIARGTWGDGLGKEIAPGTFTDVPEGPWVGVGRVHFFTDEEVRTAFSPFAETHIEELSVSHQNRTRQVRHWLVTARKAGESEGL